MVHHNQAASSAAEDRSHPCQEGHQDHRDPYHEEAALRREVLAWGREAHQALGTYTKEDKTAHKGENFRLHKRGLARSKHV